MKCQWCVDEGERSTIEPEGYVVTDLGWSPHYDEDGVYHVHDPNHRSGGHRFFAGTSGCAACGWGAVEARLIEVRCPASGRALPLDWERGHFDCPDCGQDVVSNGSISMTGEQLSVSVGYHFNRVEPAA